MKTRQKLAVLSIACMAALVGFALPHPASNGFSTAVRAEYVDRAGNWEHIETTVHMVNRSATRAITLDQVVVIGEGGRLDVLGVHPSAAGTVIPPLGEYRLEVSSSIPGVLPQTSLDANGVRHVVAVWEGPAGALDLTSTIRWYWPGGWERRTHVIAQGFAVAP